jgi:hypothetical protein
MLTFIITTNNTVIRVHFLDKTLQFLSEFARALLALQDIV